MTIPAETAAGTSQVTDLEPVAEGVLALVRGAKPWTVADLARAMMDADAAPVPASAAPAEFDPIPAPSASAADLRASFLALSRIFGEVAPTERRKLEETEYLKVSNEARAIAAIGDSLGERLEAIKEAVRSHMDITAQEAGETGEGTPRIASGVGRGHWILATKGNAYELPVPGYGKHGWQQRYTSPKVTVNGAELLGLYERGDITREEYLACTAPVRVYDEGRMGALIRRSPKRGLKILAMITHRGVPSASLHQPKQ